MLPIQNTIKPYRFPIRIHSSGRYFEDSAGRPFFWHGDTCWKLFWEFTCEEAAEYLKDRAGQGFTVIQVHLLPHRFHQANRKGDAPFLTKGDLTSPNPAYFAHVDEVVDMAAQNGLALLISPAWLSTWEQDWYTVFTKEAAGSYAEYLTARYGSHPNILGWIHGGDDDALPLHDAVNLSAQVFKDRAPGQLNTFHAAVKGSWVFFEGQPWYDFHMAYAYIYEDFLAQIEAVSKFAKKRPLVLGETHYELNAGISSETLRRYAYTSVLMGGAGHTYGHKDIWCKTFYWNWALCSEASHHMRVLRRLFEELDFSKLCPAGPENAVRSAYGPSFPTAASENMRVAYLYDTDFISPNLSGFETGARFMDPVSGEFFETQATKEALSMIPGRNAGGGRDWILVLSR